MIYWENPFTDMYMFKLDKDRWLYSPTRGHSHVLTEQDIYRISEFINRKIIKQKMLWSWNQDLYDFITLHQYYKEKEGLIPEELSGFFCYCSNWPKYIKSSDHNVLVGEGHGHIGRYGMDKEHGDWDLPVIYCKDGTFRQFGCLNDGYGKRTVFDKRGFVPATKEDYQNQWK